MEILPGIGIRDVVIFIHALSAAVGIGGVLTTDLLFMKFTKDHRVDENEVKMMKALSQLIWVALCLLILSGVFLVASKTSLLQSPKFLLKMIVVAMVFINGLVLNFYVTPRFTKIAFHEDNILLSDVPDHVRKIAMIAGGISIFSWLLAFLLGSIKSIPFSFAVGIGSYFGILAIIAIGASLTRKKRG